MFYLAYELVNETDYLRHLKSPMASYVTSRLPADDSPRNRERQRATKGLSRID